MILEVWEKAQEFVPRLSGPRQFSDLIWTSTIQPSDVRRGPSRATTEDERAAKNTSGPPPSFIRAATLISVLYVELPYKISFERALLSGKSLEMTAILPSHVKLRKLKSMVLNHIAN